MKMLMLGALMTLGGSVFLEAQEPQELDFLERKLTAAGEEYIYRVYLPSEWTSAREWPVLLFLHGAGERGRDGIKQTEVGLGPAIRADRDRFPMIVVMPQCSRGVWWNDEKMEQLALGSLEEAIEEFNGKRSRVYLSGLSMGGYGTFYFASKHPDRFAALVPVCGGVMIPRESRNFRESGGEDPYRKMAEKVRHLPIWVFHGTDDRVVPVEESRRITKALKELGNNVRYTEFENTGHNSWDQAYAYRGLMTWLLSH